MLVTTLKEKGEKREKERNRKGRKKDLIEEVRLR